MGAQNFIRTINPILIVGDLGFSLLHILNVIPTITHFKFLSQGPQPPHIVPCSFRHPVVGVNCPYSDTQLYLISLYMYTFSQGRISEPKKIVTQQ